MNVLITGGTHGIGWAIANRFAIDDRNEHIYIAARHVDDLAHSYVYEGIQADFTNTVDIGKVAEQIKNLHIDILINNVGGGGRWGTDDVLTTPEESWDGVILKNYETARQLTLAALPWMKQNNFGRVVTISSIYGKESGGRPWFTVAKAAEIALMKSLAIRKELVRHNITFNTVCPGAIAIPGTGWDKLTPEERSTFEETLPLGRMGTPEEVAALVCFLCSEEASLINGACITADGGESRSF
jgi:3-oxoacyl-[acyl-carrier protein] reductase